MDLSSCPIPGTVERINLMVVMLSLFLWDVEYQSLQSLSSGMMACTYLQVLLVSPTVSHAAASQFSIKK